MTALNLYTKCEDPEEIIEAFKKFAEYHVQKALKEASDKARMIMTEESHGNIELGDISLNYILNSYPLENIK